jgi:hypothetical protein
MVNLCFMGCSLLNLGFVVLQPLNEFAVRAALHKNAANYFPDDGAVNFAFARAKGISSALKSWDLSNLRSPKR